MQAAVVSMPSWGGVGNSGMDGMGDQGNVALVGSRTAEGEGVTRRCEDVLAQDWHSDGARRVRDEQTERMENRSWDRRDSSSAGAGGTGLAAGLCTAAGLGTYERLWEGLRKRSR